MPKKKTTKKAPAKKAPKKAPKKVKALSTKADGASIQDKILIALNKLFEIAKAQIFDAFKQYVETRMAQDLPALIEHFISLFAETFKAHGITEEELYASLSKEHRDYLKMSAERLEQPSKVTQKKGSVVVESNQAQKNSLDSFEVGDKSSSKEDSVFSDLDIL